MTPEQRARFAERLAERTIKQPSGCWEVQGWQLHSGHVQIALGTHSSKGRGFRNKTLEPMIRKRAHILAWELAHDAKVPAGMVVMHSCDNPPCVNPAHLSIGTQADNIHDSIHKGRFNAFGRQKLNASQVREIRLRAAAGERHADIANRFGIARNTVGPIARRETWAHVSDDLEPVRTVKVAVRGVLNLSE